MWLTIKETSDIYKIKKSTLYLWVSAGKIPHYKVGSLVRFKTDEIETWLEQFKKEAGLHKKKAKKHLRMTASRDADTLVRKAIDDVKGFKV